MKLREDQACSKPITVNEKISKVYEDMHWLCFHMLFEHDNYNPDEACDDPSCPWNRISGRTIHIVNHHSDIKLVSSDGISGIFLTKGSVDEDRLPSIEFKINLVDDIIRNYPDTIWIEKVDLFNFKNQLEVILEKLVGSAFVESMSPEEMKIIISNIDSGGHYKVGFSVKDSKYVRNELNEIKYSNSFEVSHNLIQQLIQNIDKVLEESFEK